jgi:NAD(P)-dependent dehydrogenase (short-subunit alcohol dehydrogenase family)
MAATPRISTPFTAQSTAAQVVDGVDLSGRRVIVTGGASGIGIETARALASAGAEVTLAVRNLAAGERTARDIITTTGNEHVVAASLDLADQASVASFTAAWDGPLHILVNNAGVMASPEMRTPEGWELQFATNHLGHFALATGLYGALAAAGARAWGAASRLPRVCCGEPDPEPGRGGPCKTRRSPQTPRSGKLSRSAESLVRVIAGEQ